MIEHFTSPSSKENRMVVMPFAFLLSKSGILFLSLSITALPSLPLKLSLKLTSSNSIFTSNNSNSFTAAQIWNCLSLSLTAHTFKLVFTPHPAPCPSQQCLCEPVHSLFVIVCMQSSVWVCMCVRACLHACARNLVCVCVFLPCFVWKCLLISVCFVCLYTIDFVSLGVFVHCMFFFKL